jgi:hypothetical protein
VAEIEIETWWEVFDRLAPFSQNGVFRNFAQVFKIAHGMMPEILQFWGVVI